MQLKEIVWYGKFVNKIKKKHNVSVEEVEEALFNKPIFRRIQRGKVNGEDAYSAYSKTFAGRYLFVVFIYKQNNTGIVVSARDMSPRERRYYNAQKKN
ncbi:MAG: BrnT family toxin [Candidatus Poribacteria bacterium]